MSLRLTQWFPFLIKVIRHVARPAFEVGEVVVSDGNNITRTSSPCIFSILYIFLFLSLQPPNKNEKYLYAMMRLLRRGLSYIHYGKGKSSALC